MSTIAQALGSARRLLTGKTDLSIGKAGLPTDNSGSLAEGRPSISESVQLDAELLLAFCLQQSRTYLYTWPERQIKEQQLAEYKVLLVRRAKGEPVAHLLGHREFWTLRQLENGDCNGVVVHRS